MHELFYRPSKCSGVFSVRSKGVCQITISLAQICFKLCQWRSGLRRWMRLLRNPAQPAVLVMCLVWQIQPQTHTDIFHVLISGVLQLESATMESKEVFWEHVRKSWLNITQATGLVDTHAHTYTIIVNFRGKGLKKGCLKGGGGIKEETEKEDMKREHEKRDGEILHLRRSLQALQSCCHVNKTDSPPTLRRGKEESAFSPSPFILSLWTTNLLVHFNVRSHTHKHTFGHLLKNNPSKTRNSSWPREGKSPLGQLLIFSSNFLQF